MKDEILNLRVSRSEVNEIDRNRGAQPRSVYLLGLVTMDSMRRQGKAADSDVCRDPNHLRSVELANDIEKALLKHAALIRAQAAGKKKAPSVEQPSGPTEVSARAIKAANDGLSAFTHPLSPGPGEKTLEDLQRSTRGKR